MSAARCRWHDDPGRCPDPVAAPGAPGVPELCPRHMTAIEPWVRARAEKPASAEQWIEWAARKAADAEHELRALGIGTIRPARATDDGRPVLPQAPERR